MRPIVTSFLLCVFSFAFSQKIKPITIYIEFQLDKKCQEKQKFFYDREGGTVFNLYCDKGDSFLWYSKSDTLPLSNLKNYKFTTFEEIGILEKLWRKNNKKALIKKYGRLYPPFDKNGIFQTYLIEIISDKQFVIYPVKWRGEDISCGLEEVPPPPRNNK